MKKINFIPGLLLLLISFGCIANTKAMQPDEPVGEQVYLPVINEDTLNKLPEESLDSNLQDQILVKTKSVIQIVTPASPTPTSPIENQVSENNSKNGPFNGLLKPPVPVGYTRTIDTTYRYGTTQEGTRIPHDGVEFYNPGGTPVLAAADGTVYFAGSDDQTSFGQFKNFYGNLIIIEHDFKQLGKPVFTLYAHLSVVSVKSGEKILVGEKIGEVGATGSAIGSHLHFEVRIDGSKLENRLNPELFISLLDKQFETPLGILAGNILDYQQQKESQNKLVIQPIVNGQIVTEKAYYLDTYAKNVPSDPNLQENFVLSNLPVGEYRLSTFINNQFFEKIISIRENSLTFISIFPEE